MFLSSHTYEQGGHSRLTTSMPSCCFPEHPTSNGMVIGFLYLGAYSCPSPLVIPGRVHQNTWSLKLVCFAFCLHAMHIRGHLSWDLWATVSAHRTAFRDESCLHIARRFRGESTTLHIARMFLADPA